IAAHTIRPAPLKIASTPTSAAAPEALKPAMPDALGFACEIREMPAVTHRVRMAGRIYHGGVRRATPWVYSLPRSAPPPLRPTGSKPGTVYPSGGLRKSAAPASDITR